MAPPANFVFCCVFCSGTPVSAKKQSQLRDVLSRRTHTPLRAAPIGKLTP